MLDAEVDSDAEFVGHVAVVDELVLGKGAVLAVASDEAVVVFAEDIFDLRLGGVHRHRDANHDVAAADTFFQRGVVAHLIVLLGVGIPCGRCVLVSPFAARNGQGVSPVTWPFP